MDYENFLPDIDIADGKKRVMGNMSLYARLLARFDGVKMSNDILVAANANDEKALAQAAHALKGTAANLGFPVMCRVVSEIDALCKQGKSCEHLKQELQDATDALMGAIKRFMDELKEVT